MELLEGAGGETPWLCGPGHLLPHGGRAVGDFDLYTAALARAQRPSRLPQVRSNPPRGGMWIPSQMWYTPGKQIPTQEYMDSKEYTKLPCEK